jgi:hypothetical protein
MSMSRREALSAIAATAMVGNATHLTPVTNGGRRMVPHQGQDVNEGLQRLVGTWRPTDPSANADTVFEVSPIAGGYGVYSVYRVPLADGEYVAHALWAHDPAIDRVRVFEVKSTREVWYHEGGLSEDGALVLERTATTDATQVIQRGVLRWPDLDTLTIESELLAEDGSTTQAVVEFKRQL